MSSSRRKIVIGIPSYNEEDTISYVVRQIDLGLKKFYPSFKNLIINVDSNSEDGTKEAFLKTHTFSDKQYLNKGKRIKGKGRNIIELFKYCDSLNIDFIALFDSDIKTVRPNWVYSLLSPLITEGFDYTTPVYSRSCFDGNVTNNFAYPLTYAVFGVDIQQPIGGEFGLNKRLYEYLLKQPIDDAILGFGIDVFMTYHAIGGGFKICEIYLGEKKHKPGFSTLMAKFLQISEAAIEVSKYYKNRLYKVKPVRRYNSISVFKTNKKPDDNLVSIQLTKFAQDFKNNLSEYNRYIGEKLTNRVAQTIMINMIDKKPTLSLNLWIDVLARLLNICYGRKLRVKSIPKMCHLIAPIFYWRVISFWEEMKYLDPIKIDEKIKNQAELLRKKLVCKKTF